MHETAKTSVASGPGRGARAAVVRATVHDQVGVVFGGSSSAYDSYLGKNEGRTKEAILNKITRTLGIIMFVLVLAINLIPIFSK